MARARPSLASLPGPRLQQVLLSIAGQAERDLELLSSRHSETRIHALRVRMKKLRAIVRLIQPGLAPTTVKAIRRSVRTLRRAFAVNRDQQVLNKLLTKLSDGAVTCQQECSGAEKGIGPDGLSGVVRLRRLQATARALTQRLQTMRLRPLAWADVAKAYARRYAKARRWFRRCEHKSSAERLHRWRTPVKDHYFQSLLMRRERHHLNAARKLASLLGQIHDLAMLREHHPQGYSDRIDRVSLRQMKKLRVRIFRQARRLFVSAPGAIERQVRAVP